MKRFQCLKNLLGHLCVGSSGYACFGGGGTVSSFEGKDAARSKDAKRRRCKASIINVILKQVQDDINIFLKRTYRPNVLTSYRLKKCAFTLAEVLITLGIIGVVAAMTIPTVVAKYQHKVLETQFKKAYSILYQLVLQVQNDTGMPLNVKDYSYAYTGDKYKLYNALKPYIIANFCKTTSCIDTIEVDDGTSQNMKEYKTYNNKVNTSSYFMECGDFILPDGVSVYIEAWNDQNLMLSIDVNGVSKRPNRWGHDLFTFSIDNETGKLIPNGVKGARFDDTLREWGCSLTTGDKNNGITCSYYALTDPDYFKKLPK